MKKVAVIGAGSWGTALAVSLAVNGHDVRLWGRNTDSQREMQELRENRRYLEGVKLPENVTCTSDAEESLRDVSMAVFVVPAQTFRENFEKMAQMIPEETIVVNCAKGIEMGSLKLISQIAEDIKPGVRFAVLSGPSHAEEVGKMLPTTLVAASSDQAAAREVQDMFMSEFMRVYTNDDVVGLEIGGALKNIIALGAGISDGMGYGDNAKAALMTRGLTEISRLGVKMGGDRLTFMGLAGIGDLIATCTSMHSRNRRAGILIGQGVPTDEAVKQIGMVVESMYTTQAAYDMAAKYGVEMPITEQIYKVIKGETSGPEAVRTLMLRQRKNEME